MSVLPLNLKGDLGNVLDAKKRRRHIDANKATRDDRSSGSANRGGREITQPKRIGREVSRFGGGGDNQTRNLPKHPLPRICKGEVVQEV